MLYIRYSRSFFISAPFRLPLQFLGHCFFSSCIFMLSSLLPPAATTRFRPLLVVVVVVVLYYLQCLPLLFACFVTYLVLCSVFLSFFPCLFFLCSFFAALPFAWPFLLSFLFLFSLLFFSVFFFYILFAGFVLLLRCLFTAARCKIFLFVCQKILSIFVPSS